MAGAKVAAVGAGDGFAVGCTGAAIGEGGGLRGNGAAPRTAAVGAAVGGGVGACVAGCVRGVGADLGDAAGATVGAAFGAAGTGGGCRSSLNAGGGGEAPPCWVSTGPP